MSSTASPPPEATDELGLALVSLANVLDRFRFRLPTAAAEPNEHVRAEAVRSIRDYLLPRLDDRDAPLVVSVFGASGSGKSTIANAIARKPIGTPGAVRPSTQRAVVWAHRSHAARYWREFLSRVREQVGPAVDTIVGDDPITTNLTLIDTPPFDVVAGDGSEVAKEVLAVTDLAVFVASALRYADAEAWSFIHLMRRRGVPILFVLNRLPADPAERSALRADYARRLAADGLLLDPDPSLVFAVAEQAPDPAHGGLPYAAVAGLRKELEELTDRALRRALVQQANHGAVLDLANRVAGLGDAAHAEAELVDEMLEAVEDAYRRAGRDLEEQLGAGGLAAPDRDEMAARIARVVTHVAGAAAQRAAGAWDRTAAGRAILDGGAASLWRHGADTHLDAERTALAWAEAASELPGERPGGLLSRRRWQQAGRLVPGAALLSPDDVPDLLVRELGRDDAEALVRVARRSLVGDMREVLSRDAARFVEALGDPSSLAGVAEALRAAVHRVKVATGSRG